MPIILPPVFVGKFIHVTGPSLASGVYVSPFGSYSSVSYSSSVETTTSSTGIGIISVGATSGYQYFLPNGINFQGGLGLAYISISGLGAGISVSGIGVALDLGIGYAF